MNFFGSSMVLAVFGTWGLTALLGGFIFTWPAAIFLLLIMALEVRAWALRGTGHGRRAAARLTLALMTLLLAAYWWLCRSLFLVAGLSYLAGLLLTLPLAVWTVHRTLRGGDKLFSVGLVLFAFSVFFWGSAAVLLWKNR